MSEMAQLTFDGREVPIDKSTAPVFSAAQTEILRAIRLYGIITSTAAGRILHAHREHGCRHCRAGECPYASSDGCDALKRLAERGLVRRVARGRWKALRH